MMTPEQMQAIRDVNDSHPMFLEARSDGERKPIVNQAADYWRLRTMRGQWLPAGEICCRLGAANPWGWLAERKSVRLVIPTMS